MKKLTKQFLSKPTLEIAKSLLGCYLIHDSPMGKTVGKIVETEAYLHDDPASHTFMGQTSRNAVMFGPPGKAYIYFTYGMYYCFNVVTNKEGIGEGVLIRALEPIKGINLMKERRRLNKKELLCNGPAKLVIAMGITKYHNGTDLKKGKLRIAIPDTKESREIVQTKRIGISKGISLPHRFYIRNSPFVSRKI